MALVKSVLVLGLNTIFNPETTPDNREGCASGWANAMSLYASGIIPASTTVTIAASSLEAGLNTAFDAWWEAGSQDEFTCDLLENAFANFALLLGAGMLAGSQYQATPPPGLLNLCSLGNATDYTTAIDNFATKIDTWMRTGTAIKVVPPYDTVNWS